MTEGESMGMFDECRSETTACMTCTRGVADIPFPVYGEEGFEVRTAEVECRRRAPLVGDDGKGVFPVMSPGSWCCEWKLQRFRGAAWPMWLVESPDEVILTLDGREAAHVFTDDSGETFHVFDHRKDYSFDSLDKALNTCAAMFPWR